MEPSEDTCVVVKAWGAVGMTGPVQKAKMLLYIAQCIPQPSLSTRKGVLAPNSVVIRLRSLGIK